MRRALNILLISLGCDKNLVDSEMMLGYMYEKGYRFVDDEDLADVVVINTCSFINDAKEESINTILEVAKLREEGSIKALIVAGCLVQRYKEEIQKEIREVDAVIGTASIENITNAIESVLGGTATNYIGSATAEFRYNTDRILTTGGHYAYLRIAEGCNKRCTYCAIPAIRGNFRSVPMEDLIAETKRLIAKGVKEVILVAQESTLYGMDLYKKKCLPELLKELCKLEKLQWIRILYCYPEEITEELIDVIASEDKICNYLDIPIQHASNSILKKMGRRTSKDDIRNRIHMIRNKIPDICLRTTFISGFPGETEEDHIEAVDFIDEIEFDRLGVFEYSQEEDTVAGRMPDQIDDEVKRARRDELMQLQQEIAFEIEESMIGRDMWAMVEGRIEEDGVYIARTYRDAPNVDGFVFFSAQRTFMTGDFVKVRITAANEYDLIGEVWDEFA